ncbi:MAG: hypothetical protein U0234_29480 [Sandaracinus sp.]
MSGGDGLGGLALLLGILFVVMVALPGLVLAALAWRVTRGSRWRPLAVPGGLVLGVAAGLFVTFFVVFDDLGTAWIARHSAPTIELHVSPNVHGRVVVRFDDRDPPLVAEPSGVYVVDVPDTGRVRTGSFPSRERDTMYVTYVARLPDGSLAPTQHPFSSMGPAATYSCGTVFVGTPAEQEADEARRMREDTLFDDEEICDELGVAR